MSEEEEYIIVTCPHCGEPILIDKNQIRCGIFRHAVYKHNQQQVNPHLSYLKCKELIRKNRIIGCCKPFRVTEEHNAIPCDYC
jgi:hypothetical protein